MRFYETPIEAGTKPPRAGTRRPAQGTFALRGVFVAPKGGESL
jgi:hypothetical protein